MARYRVNDWQAGPSGKGSALVRQVDERAAALAGARKLFGRRVGLEVILEGVGWAVYIRREASARQWAQGFAFDRERIGRVSLHKCLTAAQYRREVTEFRKGAR